MQFTRLNYWVTAIALICSLPFAGAQQLTRIQNFGSNPGNLKMYVYTPAGLDTSRQTPLVVVLHGCLQSAGAAAKQTGWNKLADTYGFRVLYPQQRILNNPQKCFCWYQRSDIEKGKGESFSIKQMIDEVKRTNAIDSSQVFITGLSAGAAMGVALMADYPEAFNAGAIFAGGAYKTATNIWTGILSLYGWRIKSPEKWGALVREQNPNYTGEYPRMIIYQGKADVVVNKRNGSQLMKQWTNLHGLSTTPTETIRRFAGAKAIEKNIYRTNEGKEAVLYYRIKHLGHALLVDPGKCLNQGGKRGLFSADKNYFSTYWTAVDFGLIPRPAIIGKTEVSANETATYSLSPSVDGQKVSWKFPKDCKVIQNQGNGELTLKWFGKGGSINAAAYYDKKCRQAFSTLVVKVK